MIAEDIRYALNNLRYEIITNRFVDEHVILLRSEDSTHRKVVISGRLFLTRDGLPDRIIGVIGDYSSENGNAHDNATIIADKLLEARIFTKEDNFHFLIYLIDMALTEIGYILADRDRNMETKH